MTINNINNCNEGLEREHEKTHAKAKTTTGTKMHPTQSWSPLHHPLYPGLQYQESVNVVFRSREASFARACLLSCSAAVGRVGGGGDQSELEW